MISIITRVIQKHPEWFSHPGMPLSFMKVSTPTSGTRVNNGKVLLFVFESGEKIPSLCIKTTRVYSAGDIIRHNYNNLKLLEDGARGSSYVEMFAKPLYLYDDGSLIFCIESICPGIRFSAKTHDIELVMGKYIAWQSYLAHGNKNVRKLENGLELPVLIQHGDMTPDNVLISGEDIYLIDYDYTGESLPPGFDIFNFLSKIKRPPEVLRSYNDRYFPLYFKSIGAKVESYETLFPLYRKAESKRKARKI